MSDLVTLIEPVQRAHAVSHTPPVVRLSELLIQMDKSGYTGSSTVHWHEGRIRTVEIPNPLTIKVQG